MKSKILTTDKYPHIFKEAKVQIRPFIADKTLRRNDPCSCGSGKKYKHCHM